MEKNDRQGLLTGPAMLKLSLAMKLTALLLIVSVFSVQANAYSQKAKVTLDMQQVKLYRVFEAIEAHTEFKFLYNNKKIDTERLVTVKATNQPLDQVLMGLFKNSGIRYVLKRDQIILKPGQLELSRTKAGAMLGDTPEGMEMQMTISGVVTDGDGVPLPSVSVMEKGTTNGVATDFDGNYSIQVSSSSAVLVYSYIGMKTTERSVGNSSTLNVTLQEDAQALSEVVIVGYGSQRKEDMTGSVAVISTKQFDEQPVTRVDQVLQGRAAGVQVTQAGGAPGGATRIRIRGANSVLGNNDPLYVVDGFVGADFNMINPNDIQSIQVLKDAASTSIYGSRGANGVVIITTKKGQKGSLTVNYEVQTSTSSVIKEWDVLNPLDFATVANQRSAALGTSPIYTDAEIDNIRTNGGTDWQDLIFKNSFGQQHQLSVSGGGEKVSFMVSGNYLDQDGIIENTDFKRYGLRSNVSVQASEKLNFNLNVAATRLENHNTGLLSGTGNPVVQALAWAPTTPAYDANGEYTISDPVGSVKTNPMALLFDRANDVNRNIANIIGGADYQLPVQGLSAGFKFGINYVNQQDYVFNGNVVSNNNPSANRVSTEQITLQSTTSLNYQRTFGDHNLDAVAVFETQKFTDNNFSATGNTLKFPALGYYNLSLANSYTVGSGYTKWSLLSILGRVNYSFKDKYLVSAAVRRDGSSKFSEDNRFSTFPSLALGYVLSKEDFLADNPTISFLKVRGSWGKTGSQAISPYATLSTYNTNSPVAFNNNGTASGIRLGNPGNSNLKWETTEQSDIGVELGLFKQRLSFEADYYIKNTTDLLLNQSLPSYVGGGTQTKNVGEVENKGFDFGLTATVFDTDNFNWTSNLNVSTVSNSVVSLGGIAPRIGQGTGVGAGFSTTNEFMLVPGESLASYWGLNYLGTWKPGEETEAAVYNNVPGDSHYEDLNGDGAITTDDFQVIGKGIPSSTAGWNNTFTYKDFTLNVFFQGVFGIDKLNYTRAAAMSGSGDARQFILSEIQDRYIPGQNETSNIPAFSNTDQIYTQSSRFIESGDYVRLKNVSLTYSIPNLIKEGSLKIFLSATNLFTITDYSGIDPESSNIGADTDTAQGIDYGAYPNSKTFTAGINLTF